MADNGSGMHNSHIPVVRYQDPVKAMGEYKKQSLIGIFLSRIAGIIVFLIILGILNILAEGIRVVMFHQVVGFLNANIGLILALSLFFLIGDLFGALTFPLNLPAPLFNAVGGVLIVAFIFRMFLLVDAMTGLTVFEMIGAIEFMVYPVVFIIVLIAGYASIFASCCGSKSGSKGESAGNRRSGPGNITWEEVGAEFRETVYDALHRIRDEIRRK
jgi:hypothetical protein